MTIHELILMAKEQVEVAEQKFNYATGKDVDITNTELTAARMRLNRLLGLAKEERSDNRA